MASAVTACNLVSHIVTFMLGLQNVFLHSLSVNIAYLSNHSVVFMPDHVILPLSNFNPSAGLSIQVASGAACDLTSAQIIQGRNMTSLEHDLIEKLQYWPHQMKCII